MAHDEPAGIGIGSEAVVLAVVDLHLVLIKAMPQIAGRDAERQVEAFRVIDSEGCVGQVLGLRLAHCRHDALSRQSAPYRRQFLQHRAVAVPLHILSRCETGQAIGARKPTVEVVEASVLGIDHDDVLDAFDTRAGRDASRAGCRGHEARRQQNPFLHLTPFPIWPRPATPERYSNRDFAFVTRLTPAGGNERSSGGRCPPAGTPRPAGARAGIR